MALSRDQMIEFLKLHNYDPNTLQSMETKEIQEAYQEVTKKLLGSYFHLTNDNKSIKTNSILLDMGELTEFKQKLKDCANDVIALIECLQEGYMKFDYSEVNDLLAIALKDMPMHKMQKISHIAYRSFQEILLSQIATALKGLPKEEFKVLEEFYEKRRNDTQFLHQTIDKLKDPATRQQILTMACVKLMVVKDFMPSNLYDVYRDYYNNVPQKLELVAKVRALTGLYSKEYLKEMPFEELEALYQDILKHNEQEEQDRKMFLKYSQAIQESVDNNDDEGFNEICYKAVTHLTQKQLSMLVEYMNGQNPFFLSKFESVAHEYKKKLHIKR
ncbi:hypothetical protein [uncultured Helicobacter sp.]|uniref:hypothetical protein n=1 Tax=uncultured Helicobacter sp. TaxID=175537 RepID=UPI00375379CB